MSKCVRLDLKNAIIFEDSRRVLIGAEPINNIRKLAIELVKEHQLDVDIDALHKSLWKAHKRGLHPERQRTIDMDEVVETLCKVLNTDRETLIIEGPLYY